MRLLLLALLALAAPLTRADGPDHFARHHPDVHHRLRGMTAIAENRPGDAAVEFRASAHYADKGSQAMLGEMHWEGTGVPHDRALAYAWMDLAAERGYPLLVGKRENYWNALTDAERQRVADIGPALYAEFGDAIAQPRLDDLLRAGTLDAAGSRVGGTTAFVDVYTNIERSSLREPISGVRRMDYYDPRFWRPRDYWKSVDLAWSTPPRDIVEVLPLRKSD
jgi:hypothetical protein